jgi:hypothetical protein
MICCSVGFQSNLAIVLTLVCVSSLFVQVGLELAIFIQYDLQKAFMLFSRVSFAKGFIVLSLTSHFYFAMPLC